MGRRYLYDKSKKAIRLRQKEESKTDPNNSSTQVFKNNNEEDEKTKKCFAAVKVVQPPGVNVKADLKIMEPSKSVADSSKKGTDHIYSRSNCSRAPRHRVVLLSLSNQSKLIEKAKNNNIEVHLINSPKVDNFQKTTKVSNQIVKDQHYNTNKSIPKQILCPKKESTSHRKDCKLLAKPDVLKLPGVIKNLKYKPIVPKPAVTTIQANTISKPVSPVHLNKRIPTVIQIPNSNTMKSTFLPKTTSLSIPKVIPAIKSSNIIKIEQNNFTFKPNLKSKESEINTNILVNKRAHTNLNPLSGAHNLKNINTPCTSNNVVQPMKTNTTHCIRKQSHNIVVRSSPVTVTTRIRQTTGNKKRNLSINIDNMVAIPTNFKKEKSDQFYQVILPGNIKKEKVYPVMHLNKIKKEEVCSIILPDDIKKEKVEQIYPVALQLQDFDKVLPKLEDTQILGI